MKTIQALTIVILTLFSVSSLVIASDKTRVKESVSAQIANCATIQKDATRLRCYDSLSTEMVKQKSEKPELEQLPEDIGGGKFDTSQREEELSRGLVVSCKKSLDKKWFFIFDNGQVWKQVNADNRRYNYKGCNFYVTVKKDGFGYKMQIDGKGREIRIKRN
ncbi:MAG: hypothetical protein ACI9SP_004838, partial [Arenicella sp.]